MFVECPQCQTLYRLSLVAIGSEGRNLKCANCGNEWFQSPDNDYVSEVLNKNELSVSEKLETLKQHKARLENDAEPSQSDKTEYTSEVDNIEEKIDMLKSLLQSDDDDDEYNSTIDDDYLYGDDAYDDDNAGDEQDDEQDIDQKNKEESNTAINNNTSIPDGIAPEQSKESDDNDTDFRNIINEAKNNQKTSRHQHNKKRLGTIGVLITFISAFIFMLSLPSTAVFYKDKVIKIAPFTIPLYKMAGIEQASALDNFTIKDVNALITQNDQNNNLLYVDGFLLNNSNQSQSSPILVIQLQNTKTEEMSKEWHIPLEFNHVNAQEALPFFYEVILTDKDTKNDFDNLKIRMLEHY